MSTGIPALPEPRCGGMPRTITPGGTRRASSIAILANVGRKDPSRGRLAPWGRSPGGGNGWLGKPNMGTLLNMVGQEGGQINTLILFSKNSKLCLIFWIFLCDRLWGPCFHQVTLPTYKINKTNQNCEDVLGGNRTCAIWKLKYWLCFCIFKSFYLNCKSRAKILKKIVWAIPRKLKFGL